MTADEIGDIVGCYPADAVTRLRARRNVNVTIVGYLPRQDGQRGPQKRLYQVERTVTTNMKTTTITCDNCQKTIQRSTGDRWPVNLKIQGRYTTAWVSLGDNLHLCEDCWPVIIEAPPEQAVTSRG